MSGPHQTPPGFQEGDRFLSFSLGKDDFAIPLMKVREVIAVPEFTPVPHSPSHFLGMTNIRGQIITAIDLRLKLGIKPNQSAEPAIVIIDLAQVQLGVLVDSVNSVLTPKAEHVSGRPVVETRIDASFIQGIYRRENQLVILLDIERALGASDWNVIKANKAA